MNGQAGRIFLRYIGCARNLAAIQMMNRCYNLKRYETILRLKLHPLAACAAAAKTPSSDLWNTFRSFAGPTAAFHWAEAGHRLCVPISISNAPRQKTRFLEFP
jgi:hypothetical protein